jgi:hypothetical protein
MNFHLIHITFIYMFLFLPSFPSNLELLLAWFFVCYIHMKPLDLHFKGDNSVSSMETTMNWLLSYISFLVRGISYKKWLLRLSTPAGTDPPQWLMGCMQHCFGNLDNADMATLGCSASLTHYICIIGRQHICYIPRCNIEMEEETTKTAKCRHRTEYWLLW